MQEDNKSNIAYKEPVIVRVWKPTDSKNVPILDKEAFLSGGNPGHVSIETKEFYASFWPGRGVVHFVKLESLKDYPLVAGLFGVAPGRFVLSLNQDETSEASASGLPRSARKKADVEVVLTSLDAAAMKKAFEKYQAEIPGWTFIGNSAINRKAGHSCSSLAYHLLQAGGIQKLTGWYEMQIMVVTPSHIAALTIKAKEAESKKVSSAVQEGTTSHKEEESQVQLRSSL